MTLGFMHLVLRLLLTAFLGMDRGRRRSAGSQVRQALGPMCAGGNGQPFDDCFHLWGIDGHPLNRDRPGLLPRL